MSIAAQWLTENFFVVRISHDTRQSHFARNGIRMPSAVGKNTCYCNPVILPGVSVTHKLSGETVMQRRTFLGMLLLLSATILSSCAFGPGRGPASAGWNHTGRGSGGGSFTGQRGHERDRPKNPPAGGQKKASDNGRKSDAGKPRGQREATGGRPAAKPAGNGGKHERRR